MLYGPLAERVDNLEDYMKDLSYQALKTERELARLSTEMREFKDQAERDRRAMNRKWGELANKMGTLVEDIVAPNLPRVARELFGCEDIEYFAVRVRKRQGPETMELDALAVCANVVLINEAKSVLSARDVDEIAIRLEQFPRFFPEFGNRREIGIIAGLYADESLARYATSKGVLVMAMGDETMQILNPEAVA